MAANKHGFRLLRKIG